MRETAKIVSLASALAALAGPAPALQIAAAADSDESRTIRESKEGIETEPEISLPGDLELMSFTVHQTSDGLMFPQHGSHSSHSSHSSHVSHASSSPGYGGAYVPYVPNPVYVPPVYAPPVVAPPAAPAPTTSPTTAPPPAAASDPAYLACTRALNGLGVNQIAGELQQVYGLATNDAVNIAQQALASVLGTGHYCDAYLGE
ncbi:His-Xaa-Ser repeat protein HxsA2 [Mycolicibacterium septicum]|uniref:His-Xaa-Ser repeat protein HxsA2 n=1 Tax=Mycolicibacterium septicum TaxID=98668 RepID=UPI00235F3F40|nr:His-Xaa-Ser repeat protein HxsA2 [Mycolicibacterium septicum]